MNETTIWFLIVGLLLSLMVLGDEFFKRAAISTAIVYLAIGFGLGPQGLDIFNFNPIKNSGALELVSEIVVLVSLFSAGLKLRIPFRHAHWRLIFKLATLAMLCTVALIAVTVHFLLKLPWPLALLVGGILAPTDPVLASAVQVEHENDEDRLRTALTGEAGLNDGAAFPVIMVALTMLGLRWTENEFTSWLFVDLFWASLSGLGIGYGIGFIGAKALVYIHPKNEDELIIEDFVSIGLIALSYGLAVLVKGYGFLAVFACGLAFARVELRHFDDRARQKTADFSPALIRFTSQLERIGEVLTVILVGAMLAYVDFKTSVLCFSLVLILLIRPISVIVGTLGSRMQIKQRALISWFGIRGVGSIYYLSYIINHGVVGADATTLISIVYTTIAMSILVHGVSANPFMRFYNATKKNG